MNVMETPNSRLRSINSMVSIVRNSKAQITNIKVNRGMISFKYFGDTTVITVNKDKSITVTHDCCVTMERVKTTYSNILDFKCRGLEVIPGVS